ncbi:3-ketoacyl-ACP reductase [Aureimonas endophytica]|uniref:3-ketoacyl-ACP reductase n=1 Tax=Aureimonas endophytica TaxID=2027858 RepID=A0A916ZMX6_9HYPH|nr:SDR family oxidoreductase [Aureimonas endophytica]GGE04139.1 3-ketoacyl-ACP reductase [Aureimonas endophytica]
MARQLNGRIALVVGAAQGIGAGIARCFAAEGAQVVLADLDARKGRAVAAELGEAGLFVEADLADPASLEALAAIVLERFGHLDILVQNAGIYPEAPLETMSLAHWERVLRVNLTGSFLAVQACLPALKRSSAGRIVLTSSITGPRVAAPGTSAYAASKGGINGFIRAAALELAPHRITVNGIEPGNIMTEGLASGRSPEFIEGMRRAVPLGRLGLAEDVAAAALYLASTGASYVTGTTIVVDGGQILPESADCIPTT